MQGPTTGIGRDNPPPAGQQNPLHPQDTTPKQEFLIETLYD